MKKKVMCMVLTMVLAVTTFVCGTAVAFAADNEARVLYSQDFSEMNEGDMFGGETGLTVSADKKAVLARADCSFDLQIQNFSEDWEFTCDMQFPNGGGYTVLNVKGTTGAADSVVEYTLNKRASDSEDGNKIDTFFKDKGEFITAGALKPVPTDVSVQFKATKIGNRMSVSINGDSLASYDAELPVNIFTGMGMFSNVSGLIVDNILLKEVIIDIPVESVVIAADKTEISTVQSAAFTATVNPDNAKVTSYEWKVDGVAVVDATNKKFVFKSAVIGNHNITCTVGSVVSNTVSVTVKEASDAEKDAIYYENFDAMADDSNWGNDGSNFKVNDGKASTTGINYTRSDLSYGLVKNWDYSMDVTFNENVSNDSYFGIVAKDITEVGGEVEFNLKKAPVAAIDAVDAAKDEIIIKIAGANTFTNSSETYGKMPELSLTIGEKMTLRVIRYEDQLEVYLNGVIAIKTYLSNPATTSGMFIYNFNDGGKSVSLDNIIIKPAAEITDKVLPPVVEVTSAYISASAIELIQGETTTLTANCEPFDATPTTYQWYKDGIEIAGATAKTYAFVTDAAGTFKFTCKIDGKVLSEEKSIKVLEKKVDDTAKKAGCGSIAEISDSGFPMIMICGIIVFAGIAFIAFRKKKDSKGQ